MIELLVVVAMVVLMMSLLLPALSGWGSSAGRRGAVTMVMNTLEQARVAALESGQTVYVGFADEDFPTLDMQYSAFLVFRDATEEEKAAGGPNYVILKKWTRLPKNISFKRVANSMVPQTTASTQFSGLGSSLPAALSDERFPHVAFTSSGSVQGGGLVPPLFIYEGYFANGQDNFTRNAAEQSSSAGLFEKITISRYTGRVQLDVTVTGT
ncbi:MAG: hypothetical protein WEB60_05115 [Terrimicrobiaceae bacterium]